MSRSLLVNTQFNILNKKNRTIPEQVLFVEYSTGISHLAVAHTANSKAIFFLKKISVVAYTLILVCLYCFVYKDMD